MRYPREIPREDISEAQKRCVLRLAGHLVDGPSPQHAVLRTQLAAATISTIRLTGAGMYADFRVPSDIPSIGSCDLQGGQVAIHAAELDVPAGALLWVRNGSLAFLEVYTHGNRVWPDEPHITALTDVVPLEIPERLANER